MDRVFGMAQCHVNAQLDKMPTGFGAGDIFMIGKKIILVVEDNMINRMMLCQILSSEYEVLEAENGREALDVLKEFGEDISLILLDIIMPVMDGYTFLSHVKADSAFSAIPVIVTTQSDGESDEVTALSHGATDFVAKPYKPQIILHRVASIIHLRETAAMINQFKFDRLTGLFSKEFFYQRVKEILVAHPEKQYDIICSDIENFKLVNDIFGIPAGDSLLCGMAKLYRNSVGNLGICGRFNADQFACLLERRWDYTDEMFIKAGATINSMSNARNIVLKWGIYSITDTSISVEQMCDRALLAVRSIKGQYGVHFARYDEKLRSRLLREQAITDIMEPALAQGQFEIYLQPKYRIEDSWLAGAEVLVRWRHPQWGMQSPGEFIPLFEKNGFITKLDQYVWDRACQALRAWEDKGYPPFCVSVNVSRADIYNADIADILIKIVEKYDLPPSRLHLEITESAYTENPAQIITTVKHLRELGFIIEMDDFGSGYSSLNMLNEMPIDILKLDMKFIQNETAKSGNRSILNFIMGLARWMNLSVVAEGVETKGQLERLREIGCDYVQGYYFAKPMPCNSFERLIQEKRGRIITQDAGGAGLKGTVRQKQENFAQFLQSDAIINAIPGGVAIYKVSDIFETVYFSEGVPGLTGYTVEEYEELIKKDAVQMTWPEDTQRVADQAMEIIRTHGDATIEFRKQHKDGHIVWVRAQVKWIGEAEDGLPLLHCVFHNISELKEAQQKINISDLEQLRRQYNEQLMAHYCTPGPDALIVGHCNITQNKILEIIDYTDSALLETFSDCREAFFTGLSTLIVEPAQQKEFLDKYLNRPSREAFNKNKTEIVQRCFVRLPGDERGRYVQFKVNLIKSPDTGDITGILTVTDVTEQTISDKILHQLSVASCDLVVDVDLFRDTYTVLSADPDSGDLPRSCGSHSGRLDYMFRHLVVPRDKDNVHRMLAADYIQERLKKDTTYTISYSITGEKGDILTKKLSVSAVDLRLGRVCLARTDITDSIREQQSLLSLMAYTFELMGLINVSTRRMTMHTRQTVLENLPPYIVEDYEQALKSVIDSYGMAPEMTDIRAQFYLDTILQRLEEKPSGYDFVFPYQAEGHIRYKQVNVLWGDANHRIVCMVRADVTDMLTAERQSKEALEEALTAAREANRAKSDFLSSMSHDIRTPMNAIMGMTSLAMAHLDDVEKVKDYLDKISISSSHLLSLINDVLDMSKIERSQIHLNRMKINLRRLLTQLSAIMAPQAEAAGLNLDMQCLNLRHENFYGDALRIKQVFINILSNAVKYTPQGGRVDFTVEELDPKNEPENIRYRFTIRDTGIGMDGAMLEQVFAPFARGRSVSKTEGTGLGLSITKGLVDLMGGTVTVDSRIREGTRFSVELEWEPVDDGGEMMTDEVDFEALRALSLSGRSFLVAEDNTINAEIIGELLTMNGARCVIKTDGREAVREYLKAVPGTYDAILMDIQMPEMNGYEAARAIRQSKRLDAAKIPIVAMTANAFAEDVQAALAAGMSGHVAKPIDMGILTETLYKLFCGQEGAHED